MGEREKIYLEVKLETLRRENNRNTRGSNQGKREGGADADDSMRRGRNCICPKIMKNPERYLKRAGKTETGMKKRNNTELLAEEQKTTH